MVIWYHGSVKTTLELPDDLMRAIKVRAAQEDRRLKDVVAELLRRGLSQQEEPPRIRHRVKLPLVQGKPAAPGKELTPEQIAEILIQQEVEWYGR